MAIELGRPSRMGIIQFATGEGTFGTEKNLEDHVIGPDGTNIDLRLGSGAVAFLAQFRDSNTATFRYCRLPGQVTDADGIYWTSRAGQPEGETGISVDSAFGNDKLNIYFASSDEDLTLEIRVFDGHL